MVHKLYKKLNIKGFFRVFSWMNKVSGRLKWWLLPTIIVRIIVNTCGFANILVMRYFINCVVSKDMDGFFRWGKVIVLLTALSTALGIVNAVLCEYAITTMTNYFKSYFLRMALNKNYAQVSGLHSGELMNRLDGDASLVGSSVLSLPLGFVNMLVTAVGSVGILYVMRPEFLYIMGAGVIIIGFGMCFFRPKLKAMHKAIREASGRLQSFLYEHLGNLTVLKAFTREKQTVDKAGKLMKELRSLEINRVKFSLFSNSVVSIPFSAVYMMLIFYGYYGVVCGTVLYGDMIAIMQLMGMVQAPISQVKGLIGTWYKTEASAERLMEIEDFKDDGQDRVAVEDIDRFYADSFQKISFRGACFRYKDDADDVLTDFDLDINKGEYVAFMGQTGCGKSTVLKLMMSLYSLCKGELLFHDRDEEFVLDASWRGLFAYVPQGNQLLSGTIRDAVAFGDGTGQDDQIWHALDIACASDFVKTFKDGLDTELGERGLGLSEGQMQRVAIARAIFSGRPILLLDEATSSLDMDTEKKLLQNLRSMTDKTVVIVTHRLAAAEICDRVVNFASVKGDTVND